MGHPILHSQQLTQLYIHIHKYLREEANFILSFILQLIYTLLYLLKHNIWLLAYTATFTVPIGQSYNLTVDYVHKQVC